MKNRVFVCPDLTQADPEETRKLFARASAHLRVPNSQARSEPVRKKQAQVQIPRGGMRGRNKFF